jgi:hypothetical protein
MVDTTISDEAVEALLLAWNRDGYLTSSHAYREKLEARARAGLAAALPHLMKEPISASAAPAKERQVSEERELDLTKPVQTRDECKVTIYRMDAKGIYPMHGCIHRHDIDAPASWQLNGRWLSEEDGWQPNREHHNDLVNVPQKRTVWVNLPWGGIGAAVIYPSKEAADSDNHSCRLGNRAWPLEVEQYDSTSTRCLPR